MNGCEYLVENVQGKLEEVERSRRGFLIDSGLCAINIEVKFDEKIEDIRLWGPRETLTQIIVGQVLIIPDPQEWKSNIPFALLTEKLENNTYRRIGLLELRDEDQIKNLLVSASKQLVVSMNDYSQTRTLMRAATFIEEKAKEKAIKLDLTIEELNFLVVKRDNELIEKDNEINHLQVKINELEKKLGQLESKLEERIITNQ